MGDFLDMKGEGQFSKKERVLFPACRGSINSVLLTPHFLFFHTHSILYTMVCNLLAFSIDFQAYQICPNSYEKVNGFF